MLLYCELFVNATLHRLVSNDAMKLLVALVNLLSPDAIYIDLAVDGLDKAQDC